MPLEDLAEGLLRALGRLIAHFVLEVVLEILIKGPGYFITKYVIFMGRREPEADGALVVIVGIGFWVMLGIFAYWLLPFSRDTTPP